MRFLLLGFVLILNLGIASEETTTPCYVVVDDVDGPNLTGCNLVESEAGLMAASLAGWERKYPGGVVGGDSEMGDDAAALAAAGTGGLTADTMALAGLDDDQLTAQVIAGKVTPEQVQQLLTLTDADEQALAPFAAGAGTSSLTSQLLMEDIGRLVLKKARQDTAAPTTTEAPAPCVVRADDMDGPGEPPYTGPCTVAENEDLLAAFVAQGYTFAGTVMDTGYVVPASGTVGGIAAASIVGDDVEAGAMGYPEGTDTDTSDDYPQLIVVNGKVVNIQTGATVAPGTVPAYMGDGIDTDTSDSYRGFAMVDGVLTNLATGAAVSAGTPMYVTGDTEVDTTDNMPGWASVNGVMTDLSTADAATLAMIASGIQLKKPRYTRQDDDALAAQLAAGAGGVIREDVDVDTSDDLRGFAFVNGKMIDLNAGAGTTATDAPAGDGTDATTADDTTATDDSSTTPCLVHVDDMGAELVAAYQASGGPCVVVENEDVMAAMISQQGYTYSGELTAAGVISGTGAIAGLTTDALAGAILTDADFVDDIVVNPATGKVVMTDTDDMMVTGTGATGAGVFVDVGDGIDTSDDLLPMGTGATGTSVSVNGGTMTVIDAGDGLDTDTTDDFIPMQNNAAGTSVSVNGGTITVVDAGDGLDTDSTDDFVPMQNNAAGTGATGTNVFVDVGDGIDTSDDLVMGGTAGMTGDFGLTLQNAAPEVETGVSGTAIAVCATISVVSFLAGMLVAHNCLKRKQNNFDIALIESDYHETVV